MAVNINKLITGNEGNIEQPGLLKRAPCLCAALKIIITECQ